MDFFREIEKLSAQKKALREKEVKKLRELKARNIVFEELPDSDPEKQAIHTLMLTLSELEERILVLKQNEIEEEVLRTGGDLEKIYLLDIELERLRKTLDLNREWQRLLREKLADTGKKTGTYG